MLLACLSTAGAGELEGEIALDGLHAASTSEEPSSGPEPTLAAQELGMHVRGEITEGRFLGALDYHGREPVGGTFPNTPFRLLYRAEGVATLVEERWDVAAGRFLAPSVVFLPVDGVRTVLTPSERLRFEAFGGRRGISTARANLGFDVMLPAAGGSAGYLAPGGSLDATVAWAGDQVILGTPADPFTDTFTALNAQVRGMVAPSDALRAGVNGAVAERATYVLGPVPEDPELAVQALDLFHALGWVSLRASDDVRLDYDALHQAAELSRGGVDAIPPGELELVDPTFTDNRLKAALRPADLGWIRPDVRLRLRPARTELRYGIGADATELGIPGAFLSGAVYVDDVLMDRTADDVASVDRLLWTASTGYHDGGFEGEVGASFIDRAAAPVSGRVSAPGQPTTSDDLSPFVLEAENVLFARAFFAGRRCFGGLDLEVNALDPEVRAFLQLGVLTEAEW